VSSIFFPFFSLLVTLSSRTLKSCDLRTFQSAISDLQPATLNLQRANSSEQLLGVSPSFSLVRSSGFRILSVYLCRSRRLRRPNAAERTEQVEQIEGPLLLAPDSFSNPRARIKFAYFLECALVFLARTGFFFAWAVLDLTQSLPAVSNFGQEVRKSTAADPLSF